MTPADSPTAPGDDPHVLAPGTAPTPFTADEIRRGCPHGRRITLLVEPADGPTYRRVSEFVDPDAEGATLRRWRIGADGEPVGPVESARTTWLDLQRHASFPEAVTRVGRERVDLPLGHFDTLRYTVGEGEDAETFWFALAYPGMPVRFEGPGEGGGRDRTTIVASEVP